MAQSALERAKQAFYRKRYNDVITLLETNVVQYRDSFPFYFYLGLACLYTGDVGGATSYFQRARQIKLRDPELLIAQAALFLRRGETHQAVEYYLEALEYAPEHRLAKWSLDFIRKKGDAETIAALVENGKIRRFYPNPKRSVSIARFLVLPGICLVVAAVVWFGFPLIKKMGAGEARADLSSLRLASGDRSVAVELGGSYRYILTDAAVLKAYDDAQRYFQSYRDNAAQVEINRLLYSNASAPIKQKARLLMDYLGEPGFDSIKDNYSYQKVQEDPYLYLDCWIVWKGMATNIRTTDNILDCDFLVGYDTRSTLEGIVPVHFKTVLAIDPDKPLEVLARISSEKGKLALLGSSIFQSRTPDSR
jgi:tetratricopeptide (TPR) repeat protein